MGVRVLQVGVGSWGANHKRLLEEAGVLVGTVDPVSNADFKSLDDVDIEFDHAVVCTPPKTHYAIAKRLLAMGIHVFVEKPLAETSAQCQELLEYAESNRLKLQCGYIERFNPIVKRIPTSKFMTFTRTNRHYPRIEDSILMDTAVHDIDLALMFYGMFPKNVTGINKDNHCMLILDFGEAGTASINTSWETSEKIRMINNTSIITSENILRTELSDFLIRDHVCCWNALDVQRIVEMVG
jgi:UDP-N-acetylglucosamine 3-dehydrogenase